MTDWILIEILLLTVTLVFLYMVKRNEINKKKDNKVAVLFTLFFGASMALFAIMLYNEKVVIFHELGRYIVLVVIILLPLFISGALEAFGKLSEIGNVLRKFVSVVSKITKGGA